MPSAASRLCRLLEVEHPIIQAGVPWVAGPELVAAVSNAGALGVLHPTAEMPLGGSVLEHLRTLVRRTRRLTSRPLGVALFLGQEEVRALMDAALEEGVHVLVTSGGSPALYTGYLKDRGAKVLHHVASVRHARAAQAQGVDAVIAAGYAGGGLRGVDEVGTLALVPQVADAVDVPVVASGGIGDARGVAAALVLGAEGVQLGTRFVATEESAAHPRFKEALLRATDTGTVVAGRYRAPTRLLRNEPSLRLREEVAPAEAGREAVAVHYDERFGLRRARAAMLEGDVEGGIAYCGAGVGLISEVLPAAEVVRRLVEEVPRLLEGARQRVSRPGSGR